MNHPLSFPYFVLAIVVAISCFIAFFYISYRKSEKLRDIVGFTLHPQEYCANDFRIVSIIKSFLWFFIIHMLFSVVYHFADLIFYSKGVETNIGDAIQTLPLWVVLILPPILEETAFRLSLKRKRLYIALSCTAIMFFVSAVIFSTKVYDVTWQRLFSCVVVVLIAWLWGYKWILKLNFKTWLWALVLFFSILHIINYDLSTMDMGELIRVVMKEAVKIPSALMFCYIRLKHGFTTSITLHFAINLSAFLLGSLT